jgi:hypothetical protein
MEKRRYLIIGGFLVYLVICISISATVSRMEFKEKYKHKGITTAEAYDAQLGPKSMPYMMYRYTVNDSNFQGTLSLNKTSYLYISALMHKKFPLVYAVDDPAYCYILLTKEDFERFDLPFPDSLKWVSAIIK